MCTGVDCIIHPSFQMAPDTAIQDSLARIAETITDRVLQGMPAGAVMAGGEGEAADEVAEEEDPKAAEEEARLQVYGAISCINLFCFQNDSFCCTTYHTLRRSQLRH